MSITGLGFRRVAVSGLICSLVFWAGCEGFTEAFAQSLMTSAGQGQPFADTSTSGGGDTINGLPTLTYDVEITGVVDGEYFEREGTIRVLNNVDPTSSGNVLEVLMESGQPESSAELGAFQFATHTGLYSTVSTGGSAADLAFVNVDERDDSVTLIPDADTQAISNSRNIFTTGNGTVREAYLIDEGQIVIEFDEDGSVGGLIEVTGTNTFDGSEGRYEAPFRGELRGSTSSEDGGGDGGA